MNPARAAATSAKPNFLFLVVDDLRQTTKAWGDPNPITPNLDAFLDGATVFDNAFCTFPVCGPSRNAILGGLRPSHSGLVDNGPESLRVGFPGVVTFPELMKNNGYVTYGMGKIFHHDQDEQKSWTKYFHYPPTMKGYRAHLLPGEKSASSEFVDEPADHYPDGWLADTALGLLQKPPADQPFFMMVGLQKPHLPFVAPKKYWDLYEGATISNPAEPYFPEGMPAYENVNFYELRAFSDIPKTGPLSPAQAQQLRRGYYACVSFVDAQIGRILDGLKAAGLDQTTNVVLVADHGWQLGENNMWCKDELFDHSLRPIFAARFPGLPQAPRHVQHFVETIDIYPTLCAMTGIPAPYALDGKDLTPLLTGGGADWEDVAYAVVNRHNHQFGFTVRQGDLRYCLWLDQKTKQELAEELYDFSLPAPYKTNLVQDPAYQDHRGRLHGLLEKQIAEAKMLGVDLPTI
jgi:arylsulfatase A-like enzyme